MPFSPIFDRRFLENYTSQPLNFFFHVRIFDHFIRFLHSFIQNSNFENLAPRKCRWKDRSTLRGGSTLDLAENRAFSFRFFRLFFYVISLKFDLKKLINISSLWNWDLKMIFVFFSCKINPLKTIHKLKWKIGMISVLMPRAVKIIIYAQEMIWMMLKH